MKKLKQFLYALQLAFPLKLLTHYAKGTLFLVTKLKNNCLTKKIISKTVSTLFYKGVFHLSLAVLCAIA